MDGTRQVTVITRTRDRPALLRRAMGSVLGQSHADWRHVVVNDGGDPGPVDWLAAEFEAAYRGRLRVLHNARSLGMQNASNQGLGAASGEYVAIHDDDDSWAPAFLERCVGVLDGLGPGHRVQGAVTRTLWIFEEFDALGDLVEVGRQEYPWPGAIRLSDVAGENRFPPIAFLYRRRVHERVGLFNEAFSVLGDWDFNLRFLSRFDIAAIPEPLARWHWRHGGEGTGYANSVTGGLGLHREMEARLFNHYLRLDLESGRPGLGQLMSHSRQWAGLESRVNGLRARVEQAADAAAAARAQGEHFHRITRDLSRVWAAKERLRRSWVLARGRRPPASAPAARDAGGELARAAAALGPGDVLSLDVFDTALLRVLRRPADLFSYLAPAAGELLGRTDIPFAQARAAAERVARQRAEAGGREDTVLREIYAVFAERAGIAPGAAERAAELEVGAERALCYANPAVLAASREAARRGARVVFVSDMYLPAETIRGLLEEKGYEAPEVFASGAEGLTKHSGGLFEEMLRRIGRPAARVLHAGDHPESDEARPRTLGMRTLLAPPGDYGAVCLADGHAPLTGTGRTEALSSLLTGLARRRAVLSGGRTDLWSRLGYELAGPLQYAFARWIAGRAREEGIRRVFFLSRDGYPVEQAFRACCGRWGLEIESVYLYSSRRILNLARMDRLDGPALEFLLTADPFLRGRDFLERIGLHARDHAAEAARAGLPGLDAVLTTRDGFFRAPELREAMGRLLSALEPQILALAAREREGLLAYLREAGFAPGPVAVVDLGWAASSVRSLQDLLRRESPGCRLRGFYFGTWASAAAAVGEGCLLDSFFFHLGRPERRAGLAAECVELIEHLFAAPHATAVSLERRKEGWAPVFGRPEAPEALRKPLDRVSAAARALVSDMLEFEPRAGPHEDPFGYLESVLERVLRRPTREEALRLGALPHRDSFGGSAPCRPLARAPSAARAVLRPASLREAYDRAYWKAGFRAQLGPEERSWIPG